MQAPPEVGIGPSSLDVGGDLLGAPGELPLGRAVLDHGLRGAGEGRVRAGGVGAPGAIRVTVGAPEENELFGKALGRVLSAAAPT